MANDHLVSETYIKWFENKACNKVYCSYYNQVKTKYLWTSVCQKDKSQICYEKDRFYVKTEKVFNQRFESEWNLLISYLNNFNFSKLRKLQYKTNPVLNNQQQKTILHFLTITHKRTTKDIDFIKKNISTTKSIQNYEKELGRKLKSIEKDEFYKYIDNCFQQNYQHKTINILKKIPWIIYVNKQETPFITSNHPIIWYDEINKNGIYAPLSPKISLCLPIIPIKGNYKFYIQNPSINHVKKINILMKKKIEKTNKPILISNSKKTLEKIIKS